MSDCNIIEYPGRKPTVHPTAYIDPEARVLGEVVLSEDVVVLFGSVIRGDDERVEVGRRSVVLENSLIEAPLKHPVVIGEEVLVSHNAIIHGARVGSRSLIGIGAIVLDGAVVGEGAIVAAGALVPPGKSVPNGTLVAGVPARPVRSVRDDEIRVIVGELESVHRKAEVYRKILPQKCLGGVGHHNASPH